MISPRVLYIKLRHKYLKSINALRLERIASNTCVGLVSCDKWRCRTYDDLLLQNAFLKAGIRAEVISWQDKNINFSKYDALIITSMWGYQNDLHALTEWLNKVSNLNVINNVKIIRDNYNKAKQIAILQKNKLPIIPTAIISKSELKSFNVSYLDKNKIKLPVVIKPAISSGGANTFFVNSESKFKDAARKLQQNTVSENILIQPFVPEIENGEISVIAIDKKIVNAVVRFPGIVGKNKRYMVKPLDIASLDAELIKICNDIIKLKDFEEQTYIRMDFVKRADGFSIMEVELFEPQLFYYLLSGKKRKMMLSAMVKAVKKQL